MTRRPILPGAMSQGDRESLLRDAELAQEAKLIFGGASDEEKRLIRSAAHILSLEERNRNLSEAFRRIENLADWRGEALSEIESAAEDMVDVPSNIIRCTIKELEDRIEKGDKP
ncbi:hypothetical protein Mbo2_067 [Rhodococcus phage Mbo2]|uniref:Uncharacterized protein n=1 Tax=Rhodococcus phage Mbo2 TaxID=2936911 RepID=A0A9E7ISE1_9CAUD|nr:hypothetical protein Mbo2_067 [Rhodococcus phage Mbo2]